ncbi:MAG TPA: diguanylate cyclase [Syntrophomonadaceae bacterium]|nr:diguanylate cyclase [Syntrophomonadaceae bacterium]
MAVILPSKNHIKQLIRDFFTSIGADPADNNTLHTASLIRLFVLFPLLFVFTFISLLEVRGQGYQPQAENIVLIIWVMLTLLYLIINIALSFIPDLAKYLRPLNYVIILIELAANQIVLYLSGSLTSHGTLFIIVAIAVYRVFLDYEFALYSAWLGAVLYVLVAVLEITGIVPLSPGLSYPVAHPVYTQGSLAFSIIGGVLIGIFITFITINYGMNQVLKLNRKLEKLSVIDVLTGIPNRRFFNDKLTAEWQRAIRNAAPLSLIIVDIDYFKAYNDNYGHLGGDICLRRVAQELQGLAQRPADVAARYGGEEFAILLPDTTLTGAAMVAEAMRARIEKAAIIHDFSQVKNIVTISLGVATVVPAPNASASLLVENADQALYRAKEHGRNRVERYIDSVN